MPNLSSLIDQTIHIIPSFTLECGITLRQVPVAYKTWGKLNEKKDNVMVICHAFTGSADVEDWWGPMMGRNKAFDPKRFFIFCANVLGSPYGSASPITINPDTGKIYGPEFPPTTIRDDVRIHKLVLDHLEIKSIAIAIGGSMGGMAVLEWPLCTPTGYVKHIIPLATSSRHSAWCISWGEAQRQSIYSDPEYEDGWYDFERGKQPKSGLGAARMSALLTYRSRDSFEARFGRKAQIQVQGQAQGQVQRQVQVGSGVGMGGGKGDVLTPPESPKLLGMKEVVALHNDGHRSKGMNSKRCSLVDGMGVSLETTTTISVSPTSTSAKTLINGVSTQPQPQPQPQPQIFSAQSYLRYQGEKFISRFDANCYIHITRKLDTHDITRGRIPSPSSSPSSSSLSSSSSNISESEALKLILAKLPPRALVISIATDGLFTPSEQLEIAENIQGAELVVIPSQDGHDGFLLEFERINKCVLGFLKREFGEFYEDKKGNGGGVEEDGDGDGDDDGDDDDDDENEGEESFEIKKTSVFGEAEVDVARW